MISVSELIKGRLGCVESERTYVELVLINAKSFCV